MTDVVKPSIWEKPGVRNHATLYQQVYGEPPTTFINTLRAALGKAPIAAVTGNVEYRNPEDYWFLHLHGRHFVDGNRRAPARKAER